MTIAHPLALLLLVLAPLAAVVGARRLRRLPGRRGAVVLAVRCLLLALLVGALAGPGLVQPYRRLSVVFLVDTSASVLPAQRAAAQAWITRALRRLGPTDTAALLTFAGAPLSLAALSTQGRGGALSALSASPSGAPGTDIGAA